jgi:ubiquinone/menaquinone biosynthesis C-methylase UbiE
MNQRGDPVTLLGSADGDVLVEALPRGKHRISVLPGPGVVVEQDTWVTSYPLFLIRTIYAGKGPYVCDEIMRDEDPRYVERSIRHEVLGYVDAAEFSGKRILDFGCGSGASTMVLARVLPPCEIVGVDLEERHLRIARRRAEHFGRTGVRFIRSPSGDSLPEGLGLFDFVVLSAVFEHLLPAERRTVLPLVWRHVRPGGILFVNQTPFRYSPVETHTTGLPGINYLPDGLALRAARRFSKRVGPDDDWQKLLREGIRGGTVREILGILAASGSPALLEPRKEAGDRIDLWRRTLSPRHGRLKDGIWMSLKLLKLATGVQITPDLALAIRNEAPS